MQKEFLSYCNRNLCLEMEKEFLSYCNRNFVFGKRIFVSEFCVCVCVSEFWSQNFCPRILCLKKNFRLITGILCLKKNFCLITRILCLKKEFLVLLYLTRILCLEKEFLSQIFVCVCVSEFLSQNFCFLEKELFFIVTGILKRKVFYMSKVSASSQCIIISGSL